MSRPRSREPCCRQDVQYEDVSRSKDPDVSVVPPGEDTGTVISADGTRIGYRRLGTGPALILVHGAAQTSENLVTMAKVLSDQFTLFVPDRRGRGMSGPCGDEHGIAKEVEDLEALLAESGAHYVFALSAGAVIALEAALSSSEIERLALYEPPLSFDGVSQMSWAPRYERELQQGELAAAFVTVIRGTSDRTATRYLPRFLLMWGIGRAIKEAETKQLPPGAISLSEVIPTIRYDVLTVTQAAGSLDRYATLGCELLLLGGEKSNRKLAVALDGLSEVLPSARRITLHGVGHTAADNHGKPELVAAELRSFFS